jgi:uncharacterized membrane protein
MLLRYLFSRGSASADDDGSFRVRGEAVSRLEGFSDTVFGFAITLLVISLGAPQSSADLLALQHNVVPFVASFWALFALWRAQFDFFRRYGLEDRQTVRLTGVLLMIVLLAIYPLRFLSTFALDVLPRALLAGDDSMKATMTMEVLPKVVMLYAIGLAGVMAVLSMLYRHAASKSAELALSALELFDTRLLARRYAGAAIINGAIVLWCVVLLSLGADHIRQRDTVWNLGYTLGYPVIMAVAATQMLALRRLRRARRALFPHDAVPGVPLAGAE